MKHLKTFGLAALAALAVTASLGASSASATTLEIGGVKQNQTITMTWSLEPGTSSLTSLTSGGFANTCKQSHAHKYSTSPFTAETRITGTFTGHTTHDKSTGQLPSDGLSFSECTRPVTVDDPGTFAVEHIAGTTNGILYSENMHVTEGTPIGTITCTTPAAGTKLGTITGKSGTVEGDRHATLDINAVLNCGFLAPTVIWQAVYYVTSPTGLGVVA